jgi:uncharacterized protein YcgI (DUF1989 family)
MAGGKQETVRARHGKAARMKAGQRLKLVNTSGLQVVDCWAFCDPSLSEFMSMEHTRIPLGNVYARKGDTLLSNRYRKMLTIEEDTSGGAHDTLVAACSPELYREHGVASPPHRACSENLREAMEELGLKIPEQPSPFNIFQHSIVDAGGKISHTLPKNKPDCHVVLRAQCDLIIAFSACPWDVPIYPVNGPGGQINDCHFTIE